MIQISFIRVPVGCVLLLFIATASFPLSYESGEGLLRGGPRGRGRVGGRGARGLGRALAAAGSAGRRFAGCGGLGGGAGGRDAKFGRRGIEQNELMNVRIRAEILSDFKKIC